MENSIKEKIEIREATALDITFIHDMVLELAIYEKAEEEMWLTVADYEKYFAQGLFKCLIAEIEKQPCGVAIFYPAFSTWKGKMYHLEDFIVSAKMRRAGIGQVLFDAFIEYAKTEKAKLVNWQVLDWNEPALNFYKKQEALIETNWWSGKLIFAKPS